MAAEKTLAIVLRVVDFSESSCVVTLYTRDFGKIGALAKGGRRPKGPFEGALDVLSVCRIVFLHKSSQALDLLTEAKLERRFRAGQQRLDRLYSAYYVAELVGLLTTEHDTNSDLYDLADFTLGEIEHSEDLSSLLLHFELNALQLCGHLPELESCVVCGRAVPEAGHVAFGLLAGGVVCERCRSGQRKVVRISRETIKTMQRFVELDEAAWRSTGIPARVRGELRAIINQYLAHHIGRIPRLRAYLNEIIG